MTRTLSKKSIVSRALFVFAAVSLATAFVLNALGGRELTTQRVAAAGGEIGPLRIENSDTVLDIRAVQDLPVDAWSDLTFSLLDANKRYLSGFGKELWHEDGYDAEGYYWNQHVDRVQAKIVVDEPGTYYLRIAPQSNLAAEQRSGHRIAVAVEAGGYSYIPHLAAGVLALVAAVLISFYSHAKIKPSGEGPPFLIR